MIKIEEDNFCDGLLISTISETHRAACRGGSGDGNGGGGNGGGNGCVGGGCVGNCAGW